MASEMDKNERNASIYCRLSYKLRPGIVKATGDLSVLNFRVQTDKKLGKIMFRTQF